MNNSATAMENRLLRISSRMALGMGIFLPLAETVRRANQLLDPSRFFDWFDDYMLGATLLFAVYLVRKSTPRASAYLIAAWGIATGALFLSLLGQLQHYTTGTPDSGILPTTLVTVAKGLIFGYMLVGLHLAIRSSDARSTV